ncbi:MAG: endo-1,4-beta-xylanase [Saprospiraceae bacterium]|nr:endo-1,4-beta-xylanase [Saprospiraceae bacterium]
MQNRITKLSIGALLIFTSLIMKGQNSLPSCVITAPHCNAYFKEGTDITIRIYATDFGGTYTGGEVQKVELFNGDIKLGETSAAISNTYSFLWKQVPAGTYTIKAKATDNENAVSASAGVIITVGSNVVVPVGLSACKGKYLGNIIASTVKSNFNTYWNGITAENGCKWGSVEATRDVMNWDIADKSYKHAKDNHLMFRYHTLAWGSQYPSWITTLSPADFQAEMEEYMAAIAARYPLIDQIDVLNENIYINSWDKKEHAAGTPYFRAGLGGPGVTGYDWVIWLFEKARFYFPNSKLIMNDFELETNTAGVNEMLAVVKVLRDRNLIDGFGTQAHYFNVDGIASSALLNALNLMDNSGVPIYVTELDLKGKPESEENQKTSYSTSFPVYWKHPAVAGITLWGYEEGSTWTAGSGILNNDKSERLAMTWLKSYMAGLPDVGSPYCNLQDTTSSTEEYSKHDENFSLYPNPVNSGTINFKCNPDFKVNTIDIINADGRIVKTVRPTDIQTQIGVSNLTKGMYYLRIYSDNSVITKKIIIIN